MTRHPQDFNLLSFCMSLPVSDAITSSLRVQGAALLHCIIVGFTLMSVVGKKPAQTEIDNCLSGIVLNLFDFFLEMKERLTLLEWSSFRSIR